MSNDSHRSSTNLKSRTISSLLWKIFERGGKAAIELVVQIVMARLLAPDQFGALAIMLVFVNIGNVIVQSGLNTALVQNSDTDEDDCSTVFWLSSSISLVLYSIIFFSAPIIAEFYGIGSLVWPLRILALILVINSYNAVQIAIVQRELKFKKIFRATITSIIISGTVGIGMAVAGGGLWALVSQQLLYQIANCVVLAKQVTWKPRFIFRVNRTKILFSFGWKLLVSGLLDTGYRSLTDLIIGKQFSPSSLGYVSQGKKYPQAVGSMLDGSIQPVMLSAVSHVQNDVARVKRLVRRALKTSTYLIMPAMMLFALTAEPLVLLLLGEQWLPSVPFLQVYCFVYALLPIHTSNLQALNGMGRSDLFLKLEIIKKSYGVALILFAAFVLKDLYALVAMSVISGIISTFVNAHPNKHVIGYSYIEQIRDIAPAVLITFISVVVAWPIGLLALPSLATIVLQTLVMAIVYIGASRLFQVEAFEYLVHTLQDVLSSYKSSKNSNRERN